MKTFVVLLDGSPLNPTFCTPEAAGKYIEGDNNWRQRQNMYPRKLEVAEVEYHLMISETTWRRK